MNGTVIGKRYEIIDKIGEGGMAVVYKARCQLLDRVVAVKILKEEYVNDNNFVEKFKTEALAIAKISHPNIVNIYDVGQDNNIHFIVMELVEGYTLKEIIEKYAPLTVENAIDIAMMICDGLHQAHEKGVIHRDIKPQNILINKEGLVKVADFGIARAMTSATITFGGDVLGSVHYLSPEQAKGEPVNPASDIYSLACVLYEMLTGQVPYDAESPITVALKHIHDELTPPRVINDQIPIGLENIIFKAMEKFPVDRYQSADEFNHALSNYQNNTNSNYNKHKNTRLMPAITGVPKRKRKIRPQAIAIIVVAILGLISGGLFITLGNIFGSEVLVPELVGSDIKNANEEIKNTGLKLIVIAEQFHDDFEKDIIISQDPVAGQNVKEGREIKVILSKGQEEVRVPSVLGSNINDATLRIENEGLKVGNIQEIYDDKYSPGVIISQQPEMGKIVNRASEVNLIISKGKQPNRVAMPDLKGMTLEAAKKKTEELGLIIKDVKKITSNEMFSDQIISQDISAGVMVEEGSEINITISTGPGPTAQTKAIDLIIPTEQDYYKVVVKVKDTQGEREVYNQVHRAAENIKIGISFFNSGTAELSLNGKIYETYKLP